jgi:hypothetical protein
MQYEPNEEVDKIVMQVTLYRMESPDLFHLLAAMRAKKRSARIKDLAKLGLMVERGGQLSIAPVGYAPKAAALPVKQADDPEGGMQLAASMLDWGDEGS